MRATDDHCGTCTRCLDICPTGAIVAPYQLDARRCISYLTIEHPGSIPGALRPLIGNRVYGCDDCQLACPWNRFAQPTAEPDFAVRNGLDDATLVDLFAWSENDFNDAPRRQRDPAHRLRAVAAQPRGRAGQRGDHRPRVVAALRARADASVGAGTRACRVGADAAARAGGRTP